jgi:hypothetical protein
MVLPNCSGNIMAWVPGLLAHSTPIHTSIQTPIHPAKDFTHKNFRIRVNRTHLKKMMAPFAAFSPTLFLRFLLLPLLLLQLVGLVHGAVEFHGEVTPSVHFIHGVHKAPVGWTVEVECKRNCRELDTRRWVFRSDVNTADSSRFVVNLTDAVAAAEFANEGVDLEVTVKSMRKLGGRFRVSAESVMKI